MKSKNRTFLLKNYLGVALEILGSAFVTLCNKKKNSTFDSKTQKLIRNTNLPANWKLDY